MTMTTLQDHPCNLYLQNKKDNKNAMICSCHFYMSCRHPVAILRPEVVSVTFWWQSRMCYVLHVHSFSSPQRHALLCTYLITLYLVPCTFLECYNLVYIQPHIKMMVQWCRDAWGGLISGQADGHISIIILTASAENVVAHLLLFILLGTLMSIYSCICCFVFNPPSWSSRPCIQQ